MPVDNSVALSRALLSAAETMFADKLLPNDISVPLQPIGLLRLILGILFLPFFGLGVIFFATAPQDRLMYEVGTDNNKRRRLILATSHSCAHWKDCSPAMQVIMASKVPALRVAADKAEAEFRNATYDDHFYQPGR